MLKPMIADDPARYRNSNGAVERRFLHLYRSSTGRRFYASYKACRSSYYLASLCIRLSGLSGETHVCGTLHSREGINSDNGFSHAPFHYQLGMSSR